MMVSRVTVAARALRQCGGIRNGSVMLGQEKTMRKTTDTELMDNELNLVVGGTDYVQGKTGSIEFKSGTGGTSVTWPGAVGGVSGQWTMSTQGGIGWQAG
jgi:hypothetical protein